MQLKINLIRYNKRNRIQRILIKERYFQIQWTEPNSIENKDFKDKINCCMIIIEE